MAISVVMPALEMAQETGKLISWLKKEGESVAKGEPLLEVETDKAVMEIESPAAGVLAGIKVDAGVEVPVGRTIAWIVQPGEAPPTDELAAASGRKTTAVVSSTTSVSEFASQTPPPPQSVTRHVKISPKARRLASERGVNLSDVRGSGAGGEILASDIVGVAESNASAPPAKIASGNSIARLMADRTTHSWTTVSGAIGHQPCNGVAACNLCGRRAGVGFGDADNIGSKNFPAGTGAADIREIDSPFARETSGLGGDL